MKFTATIMPSGNATAVEVPTAVMAALGPQARPAVAITINGHGWRSRIALMRGRCLVGVSAANRVAAKISEGDIVEVDVVLDTAPRVVDEPEDLTEALSAAPPARAAFDRLPYGLKRKHVADILGAKSQETRARRITKFVADLT